MYKPLLPSLLVCLFLVTSSCNTKTETAKTEAPEEIKFDIPDGFSLEQIYHPSQNEHGSWVSLAKAPNNKMYACDQRGKLYSFTVPETGKILAKEDITASPLPIGDAHGLLWAFNSLYISVNKPWEEDAAYGSGIYRLTDTTNDGELDKVDLLLKLEGDGEHGPHSFTLSPDGEEIYFIAGNHTLVPQEVSNHSRLPNNWGEDNLFEPYLDARGHATDIKAPGGWVAKFNPTGTTWELISAGYRNPFDIAFNPDGELFTYDSDMEWDIGMSWYRPTRICHVTSGSEYGWRTGSGKWPAYYPDNLPAVHNLTQGSPTAVMAGSELNFPSTYKNGLFIADWSFGTVYYIDLKAKGSSYEAERKVFVTGTPLPLTDMISGDDGNLYFATGGRNLDSRVYRLSYTGNENTELNVVQDTKAEQLRTLRKQLETYHTAPSAAGLALAWEHLNHEDRFISYAARIVLEHNPTQDWATKLASETNTDKIIAASIALARKGTKDDQDLGLKKLQQISFTALENYEQINLLRAYNLSFIRHGAPASATATKITTALAKSFPSESNNITKELAQTLLYLKAEGITKKLVDLLQYHTKEKTITEGVAMLDSESTMRSEQYGPLIRDVLAKMPPSEAIYYGLLLSRTNYGWTKSLRENYFLWFYDVLGSEGGRSFKAYMENVRQTAMTNVPANERSYFQELSGVYSPADAIADLPQPIGPGETYTGEDLSDLLWSDERSHGSIADGKRAYEAAMCITCHRMRGEGGAAGPDLTQAHTKFSNYDLMFAIYSPNDEISDQYANTLFDLDDGKKIAGRIKSETATEVVLMPNPFNETYTVSLDKTKIIGRGPSPLSPMPSGLLNRLNRQEVKDLITYIQAGGDPEHEKYNQ